MLDVAAQVARPVEVAQEEPRGLAKASALQQVAVRLRQPRPLPGTEFRPPLAEVCVLDHAGAQLVGSVELGQQEVAKRLL